MQAAVNVDAIGKQYRIGQHLVGQYGRLTESLSNALKAPFRRARGVARPTADYLWAVRDVSFDVAQGEVMGILGRNGAGKTTLLKLLARITEPTEGGARLSGSVGALLEVGTGFHAELTGRENIFLSGALLGMRRRDVTSRFDEIVEFAELAKFIDTPVKRYSSGMYMRLAFAVAAHLEPDILIVDEVLAVGDASFQRKCLGKMGAVASEGRTVLFVSHNMQAMKTLCDRAVYLEHGRVKLIDDARVAVQRYLEDVSMLSAERRWDDPESRPGDSHVRLIAVRVVDTSGRPTVAASSAEPIIVETEWDVREVGASLALGFDLETDEGITVLSAFHTDAGGDALVEYGHTLLRAEIPASLLNSGGFMISPRAGLYGVQQLFRIEGAVHFEVVLDHSDSVTPVSFHRPGPVSPPLRWSVAERQT